MLFLTSLAAAAGIGLILFSLLTPGLSEPVPDTVDERLAYYGVEGRAAPLDEFAGVSFWDRIVQPQVDRLAAAVSRVGSADYQSQIETELAQSGNPYSLSVGLYLVLRVFLAAGGGTLGFGLGYLIGGWGPPLVGLVLGAGIGWIGVRVWLRQTITSRRQTVRRALPDVIDFLVVAVDAGLGFDVALNRVVTRFRNPLTEGLGLAMAEVDLGRGRVEALEEFGRRAEVQEVSAFVAMVVSTERLGVPIGQALRIQAQDLRWRRSEWAKEEASKAPLRMTIPMVALIFPTLWLILLGPAFLRLLTRGL
jgi:tight adherence protein C